MKIGIDAYEANTMRRVGIGQYAYQLIQAIYASDTVNEYQIYTPVVPFSDMPGERNGWKYITGKAGFFWTIRQLPSLIKKELPDLFFSPTHYIPWFTAIPRLAAFMDLSYLKYPEMFRTKDLLQLKYMGLYTVKHARKIFTISEFSKKEVIRYYNYPENNIVVTYPGINVNNKIAGAKSENKRLQIQPPYILFVGTIQPRKNIARLIEAFEILNQPMLRLVIAGKKGWLYEPIFDKIRSSSMKEAIIWLDYVDDTELPVLYSKAVCLALPSLYEGFGLPVLEAVSYNCPVVVSSTTSLPEVAGEAGIYVDPLNSEDIAHGLSQALQLSKSERVKLARKGQAQAEKFSWIKCAETTIKTFKTL